MANKRFKKQYEALYDDPGLLFPGCEVILWPNGEPEIWIQSSDGKHGVKIRASRGHAGMGLTINRFVGMAPLTTTGNQSDGEIVPQVDASEITITQYDGDERSQAFKRWYGDSENNPHPDEE